MMYGADTWAVKKFDVAELWMLRCVEPNGGQNKA